MNEILNKANNAIGLNVRNCESIKLLSNPLYQFQNNLDCIGLIIYSFSQSNIKYFNNFISKNLYKGGLDLFEINETINKFINLNQGFVKQAKEIQSCDILIFFLDKNRLHFAIAEKIKNDIYIIHANSFVKKVTKELLSNNLKKDLINILRPII